VGTALTPSRPGRLREALLSGALALAALAGCLGAGYVFATLAAPASGTRMLTWLVGRAFGLAGFLALGALTALGVWIRHPWRLRSPILHPEVRVRAHAALGAASVVLISGHLIALALDHYAGVGWRGALVPGLSNYRSVAVAVGVVAFYALVLIAMTAGLAGRIGRGQWLTVHRLAAPVFAMTWFHGVLAGTDTGALRVMYALTRIVVAGLVITRHLADETTVTPPSGSAAASHRARPTLTLTSTSTSEATRSLAGPGRP